MKIRNNWRKIPFWVLQLFTEAKSFESNPILGSAILNRFGLHIVRMIVAHSLTAFRRFLLGFTVPSEYKKMFKEKGYIQIDDVLDAGLFSRLQEEANGPWPQTRYFVQGDTTTEFLFLNQSLRQELPACAELFQDKGVNRLMKYVASTGLSPWMDFLRIINISGHRQGDPQKVFHSDTFHPTMKAWLFLEDVTPDKGPFEYVSGSHRLTWSRLKWEYRQSVRASSLEQDYARRGSLRVDQVELEKLSYGDPVSFTVKRNTLIIADTFGFHRRGEASERSCRLSMAFSLRLNPFLLIPLPAIKKLDSFVEKKVDEHYQATSERR